MSPVDGIYLVNKTEFFTWFGFCCDTLNLINSLTNNAYTTVTRIAHRGEKISVRYEGFKFSRHYYRVVTNDGVVVGSSSNPESIQKYFLNDVGTYLSSLDGEEEEII